MVGLWIGGAAVVAAVGAVLGRRAVDQRAAAMLDTGLRDLERRVVEQLGGTAHVEVVGDPLRVLLALREERVPEARLVVEQATLPNGLRVQRAELTSRAGLGAADLVAVITPEAVSRQLGVPGVAVRISRGRARLVLGLASVGVAVTVEDGRVVLRVPVAPPPMGAMISAGLTELVPRPPDGIELHDVSVVDHHLEVRAIVDLRAVLDDVRD